MFELTKTQMKESVKREAIAGCGHHMVSIETLAVSQFFTDPQHCLSSEEKRRRQVP